MGKYTSGPWHTFSNSEGCGVSGGVGRDLADVAHCHGFNSLREREEEEANARLISAAPELLDAALEAENALRDYVPELERKGGSMNYGRSVIAKLQAAIAKAKQ
jgi:hypothetical protein